MKNSLILLNNDKMSRNDLEISKRIVLNRYIYGMIDRLNLKREAYLLASNHINDKDLLEERDGKYEQ